MGAASFPVGTVVEVTNRFDRRWSRGFEVAEVVAGGYRLRRLSDGVVIPAVFHAHEVRAVAGEAGTVTDALAR